MSAIEITPELLADIEQKAKRASSERWEIDGLDVVLFTDCNSDNSGDMEMCQVASCEMEWDAEYIAAADPAVVLAMIERIRRLEAMNQEMLKALEDYLAAQSPEDIFEAVSQAHDVVARVKGESDD